ncbi:MAG: DNA cytosine methyltransferase [Phycisphaerales bacterium]|nr:DNA cytosine methyltransferase [Phycisphaerales bacterium]
MMPRAYYNENDKGAAAWLRELIKEGLIAGGVVDERSIRDVKPEDIKEFTQVHLFAGIGGWSLALRLARWPDDLPVWTGSCPCQPFSAAGKRKGISDDRHLWPEFARLIRDARPAVLFGEQVESAVRHGWLDGVFADLEEEDYTCGAVVLGAHSVGSPHIRQRLFWVANSMRSERDGWRKKRFQSFRRLHVADSRSHGGLANAGLLPTQFVADDGTPPIAKQGSDEATIESSGCRGAGGMEHAASDRRQQWRSQSSGRSIAGGRCDTLGLVQPNGDGREMGKLTASVTRYGGTVEPAGGDDGMGDAIIEGSQGYAGHGDDDEPGRFDSQSNGSTPPTGPWDRFGIVHCADGKARRIPVEPSLQPLAHGLPGRVGLLRGAGNAIVPQVAAKFIEAYLQSTF